MSPWELQQLKRATIRLADLLASALTATRLNVRLSPGMARERPEGGWGRGLDVEVLGNCMVIHHINESCHFIYKKGRVFFPWMVPTIMMRHSVNVG